MAARDFGLEIVLVGLKDIVENELATHDTAGLAIRIEHAPEVVAMDDSPLESVLTKPHSSIHVGMETGQARRCARLRQRRQFGRDDGGGDGDSRQPRARRSARDRDR